MNKNRLEAFSDGVFSIVITIMVLELHTPESTTLDALLGLAPQILSYLLSFLYVGIYWTNHHHLLAMAEQVDRHVLWANLHLLFWLSLIPFVTNWIASHHHDTVPVASYGAVLLMCSVSFLLLKRSLRATERDHPLAAAVIGRARKNLWSIALYAAAMALSHWLPLLASAIYVVLAILWFLPDPRGKRRASD